LISFPKKLISSSMHVHGLLIPVHTLTNCSWNFFKFAKMKLLLERLKPFQGTITLIEKH
jgi:hypothetical protein